MAFDYGSKGLGISNPFKKEGLIRLTKGVLQTLIGAYAIYEGVSEVKISMVYAWAMVGTGAFILGGGLKSMGSGLMATLRFFVGRNMPTSLAYNHAPSERETASQEANIVGYTRSTLYEMLMGRKNETFSEPVGLVARLIHSIFPRLLFLPAPIRNLAQRIVKSWLSTATWVLSYLIVTFVCVTGLAGEAGAVIQQLYLFVLLIALMAVWSGQADPIERSGSQKVEVSGSGSIVGVVIMSLVFPITLGYGINLVTDTLDAEDIALINLMWSGVESISSTGLILFVLTIASLSCGLLLYLVYARTTAVDPKTEVSELKENWQESVHPREIFTNLENIVMADRRYKEVPNRVYEALDPSLEQESADKGSFKGALMQETQPVYKPMELGSRFTSIRILTAISGAVLAIFATILFYSSASTAATLAEWFTAASNKPSIDELSSNVVSPVVYIVQMLAVASIISNFGKMLTNGAHVFFAELNFESLLVDFKAEGTFTESKLSTGMSIHDSTRSENTLVRSSITPWVMVSRLVTCTYAGVGQKNLEYTRTILEMHEAPNELISIKNDLQAFLEGREAVATIRNEKELSSIAGINKLNEQARVSNATALSNVGNLEAPDGSKKLEEVASDEEAGALRSREEGES
ncbi:hypothetical protein BZG13_07325 [Salinivibrio sp. ML323]|uniref:hypothetical protein n=1 Tax=Salinivibrio sp. ML323 TaxID=1909474 RepID=UPI0009855F3E|nr:hypothetical protein [Salinivibrio sp. ML323]OOE58328.1 hypothetical protein BZG13_07325 [Salinivibrio sp. ML323]